MRSSAALSLTAVVIAILAPGSARAATCDINWASDASGTWGTNANWDLNRQPTSADNVCIDRGAANPVVTIAADASARTVTSAEALTLTGGTFRPGQGAAGSILSGALALQGGTLHLDFAVDVTGTTTWTGSSLTGGANVLTNTGTLVLAGAGDFTAGTRILNVGTTRQDSPGTLTVSQNFTNQGTYELNGDGDVTGGANFFNDGTVRKTAGTGLSVLGQPNLNECCMRIDGVSPDWVVDTGTLQLAAPGTWTSGGSLAPAEGATLRIGRPLNNGSSVGVAGDFTGGPGVVELTDGELFALGGSAELDLPNLRLAGGRLYGTGGGFLHNAGTINVMAASTLSSLFDNAAGGVLRQAAELNFAGDVTNAGLWDFAGDVGLTRTANGSFTNSGTLRKSAGTGESGLNDINLTGTSQAFDVKTGTMRSSSLGTWNGATTMAVAAGAKFLFKVGVDCCWVTAVNGTLTGSGAGSVVQENGDLVSGATGATINFPGTMFQQAGGSMYGAGGGFLHNAGTINVTAPSSVHDKFTNDAGGVFRQQATGQVSFSGAVVNDGLWDFAADVGLTQVGNGGFTNAGTVRKSAGTGESALHDINLTGTSQTFDVKTGTLRSSAPGTWNGTTTMTVAAGAKFLFKRGVDCCWVTAVNGTLTGSGAGLVVQENGDLVSSAAGATINFPGTMFQQAGGRMYGAGGGFLHNAGTINVTAPSSVHDKFTNDAGAVVRETPGSSIVFSGAVRNDGLWDLAGDVGLTQAGNGAFTNAGTLRKSAGTGESHLDNTNFDGSGQTLDVKTGTLRTSSQGTWSGTTTMTVAAGARFLFKRAAECCWATRLNGTVNGSGAGTVVAENGQMVTNAAGATINFAGEMFELAGGRLFGEAGGFLHNAGTVNVTANSFVSDHFTNDAGATFQQEPGGETHFAGGVVNEGLWDIAGDDDLVRDANGSFTNNGTLRKSAGAGESLLNQINHDGTDQTIDVKTGTLRTNSAGTWTGDTTMSVAAGAAFRFFEPGNCCWSMSLDGTLTGSGAGVVNHDNGTLYGVSATAALDFPAGMFQHAGGTLQGSGGNLHNAGTIEVSAGAHLSTAFINDAGATLAQTSGSTMAGNVTNDGLWDLRGDGGIVATGNNNLFNNGTIRKSGGTAVSTVTAYVVSPAGTVESRSGTLAVQTSQQLPGTTLTGGTWKALGAGTLSFPSGFGIVTNAATIVVDGADAKLPELAALTSNPGSLTLAGGAAQKTSGALTNAGTITLGRSSTLAPAGAFTQPSTGRLVTEIDGRPSTGRYGVLQAGGPATLDGTLEITTGDNFTAVADDEYRPVRFTSQTGNFAAIEGLMISPSIAFTSLLNPTDLTLRVTPAGSTRADLEASDVAVTPAGALAPGQSVGVSFTVANRGDATTAGAWKDSLYLSSDAAYDADDRLIARVDHTGDLPHGGEYDVTVNAALPGVLPGSYRVLVVPDSRGLNLSVDNGVGTAASPPRDLAIEVLAPGTPATGTIAAGQERYFQVAVPAGQDLAVTGSLGTAGRATLHFENGDIPTESDFAAAAIGEASPDVFLPGDGAARTVYVRLQGVDGGAYSLSAQLISFGARKASPKTAGNTGPVTLTVEGSGFSPGTQASLTGGGAPIAASRVAVINTHRMYATFDLTGAAAGAYGLRLVDGGDDATLAGAITVSSGGAAGALVVTTESPAILRVGWPGFFTVRYRNGGDSDVPAPLIRVSADDADVRLPGHGELAAQVGFLARVADGPPDAVPPRGEGSRMVQFLDHDADAHQVIHFHTDELRPTDSTAFDWTPQKAALKPLGMSAGSWDTVFAHLLTKVGSSTGSYVRALQAAAEEAQGYGVELVTEAELLDYVRDRAVVFAPGARLHGKLSRAGKPLRDAQISLTGEDGEAYVAQTWFDGSYALWDVPAGTYALRAPTEGPDVLQTVTVLPAGSALDVDTPAAGELNGGVFTEDGEAVVGASVVILEADSRRGYETRTDGSGHFSREPLPAGTYHVSVIPPAGHAPPVPQVATVDADAGATLTFTLADGGALQGVVTGPADAPVEGATVTVTAKDPESPYTVDAVTDAAGSYHVDGLDPGAYRLSVVKAGLGSAGRDATVVDAIAVSADVTLQTAAKITGTVTQSGSGTPIAGATVGTDAPRRGTRIVTAADGTFEISDLPAGTHQIWVRAAGRLPHAESVVVGPGATVDVPVSLSEANKVSGVLRGAGQTPLPNERIALFQHDIAVGTVATRADGTFEFPKLADGDYVVGVGDGGDFSLGRAELSLTGDKPSLTIDSARTEIAGEVHDAGGSPRAGVVVQLFSGGELFDSVETFKGGGYAFTVAATGAYSLRAFGPGYGVSETEAVAVPALGPAVAVGPLEPGTGKLTVNVEDQGGNPVDDAVVIAGPSVDNPGAASATAVTDAAGVAVVEGLPDGLYDVQVVAAGKAPAAGTGTVTGPTGVTDVVVVAPGGIQGTVTGPGGAVANALVVAVDRATGRPVATSTGAAGAYLIPDLPPATYDVAVSEPGHRLVVQESVVVPAGAATTADAVLTAAAPLALTVEDAEGDPVGSVTAQLERRNSASDYRTVSFGGSSDPVTGALELGALAAGADYRLTLRRTGRTSAQITFTTDAGGVPAGLPGTVGVGALKTIPALSITATSPSPPYGRHSQLPDALTFNTNPFGWFDWLDPSGLAPPERLGFDTPQFRYEWIQYSGGRCPPSAADLQAAYVLSDQIERSYQAWVEATRAAKDIGIANIQTYLANATQMALKTAVLVSSVKKFTELPGIQGPALGVVDSILNEAGALMQNMASGGGAIGEGTATAVDQFLNLMTGNMSVFEGLAIKAGGAGAAGIAGAGAIAAELALLKNFTYDLKASLDQIRTDNGSVLGQYMSTGDMYRQSLERYSQVLARLRAHNRDQDCPPPPPPPPPPVPPTDPHPQPNIEALRPNDPNDIVGLPGVGAGNYLQPAAKRLSYTAHFENKADAGLPARTVKVTTVLDPDVDMATFELGSFGFGLHAVDVPPGRSTYTTRVDDGGASGLLVEVSGKLHKPTRTVTWTFTSLDPETGDEPADGTKGFLPQNQDTPEGVGFVTYSVQRRDPLPADASTVVSAQAKIVFDTNAAIDTNVYVNGYDPVAPAATMAALPAVSAPGDLPLSWSGADDPGGSGIASYDVLVSVDGGGFVPFRTDTTDTTDTSAAYPAQVGHTYAFIAVATDAMGNAQAVPTTGQASTVVADLPAATPSPTPTPTVTPRPPVARPRFLPDLLIGAGKSGKLVGDNLFGATGQTVTVKAKRRGKVRLRVVLQNDGLVADTISLRGPASKSGLKLAYKQGRKTVTKTVKSGKHLIKNLAPGQRITLDVTISVGAKAKKGKTITLDVKATSAGQKTAVDRVRARIAVAKK